MAEINKKVSRRARVALEKWRAYFKRNIDLYHMMHTFVFGQQWDKDEEDDMIKTYRKVPLCSNKLGTMANTLLGEQQQNTPQIEVLPMTNCDEETAKYRELIVKEILFSNQANVVTQISAQQAAIGGFGVHFIDTEYAHDNSFDLDIVIHSLRDSTRSYFDIGANHPNKIDGILCGYETRMTRKKFREENGEDVEKNILKVSGITQTQEEIALATQPNDSAGFDPFSWADAESVTILHHYEREYVPTVLYKLSNGRTVEKEELDELIESSKKRNMQHMIMEMQQSMMQQNSEQIPQEQTEQGFGVPNSPDLLPDEKGNPQNTQNPQMPEEQEPQEDESMMTIWDDDEPVRIVDKKNFKKYKVMHYKICGDYILEKSEFPSSHLPGIFVDNNSYYDKSGKQVCRSFFGDAVDTQRYINYLRTQSAYILKISRYDQWIGSKKNVSSLDTRRNWSDPNSIQGLLTFDESPSGVVPTQVKMPELSVSLFQQYQLAIDDLYTCTGLYPARMGNSGDEASGRAINARTRQGSYATTVLFNSIKRAIVADGIVINEMIPRVYDTERVLSLMTADGRKNITVNKMDEFGNVQNDIRKGTYQVRLVAGPSYEAQKQESLDSLKEVYQIDPSTFRMTADLFADNLPLANALEIRNRFKTMVPPEIIEAGKTGKSQPQQQGPTPEQMQMQMQMQQMQQEGALKQKELELKEKEIQMKQQEIMMEAQFKIQELETQRLETAGKLQEQELRYMAETERTQSDVNMSHADNLVKLLTHKMQQNHRGNYDDRKY